MARAQVASIRVLTGDRPTGSLHLGHYVGSLENRLRLQAQGIEVFLLVADYHGLTRKATRAHVEELSANVRELVLDYLAVGLDPDKVTIYRQSDVPSVAELALLFGMLVRVSELERVPTLKEILKTEHITQPSFGLLGYPVLQAADILHVQASHVPVGKDQESHIELARLIARRFNQEYGVVFPEPEAMLAEVATLPGTDGKAKMSKSLGNAIALSDDSEMVRQKVKKMYTDPQRIHPTDPGTVRGNPVFLYHDAFNDDTEEVKDLKARYEKGGVGDVEVKDKLIAALERFLVPIRERRASFAKQKRLTDDILAAGAKKVRPISEATVTAAKQAMGLAS